jgi:prepilin-type N-terminal cleavage/methylation domain-containing protein
VNRNGFSLTELIVAMTILSLGVLVLAAATTHA